MVWWIRFAEQEGQIVMILALHRSYGAYPSYAGPKHAPRSHCKPFRTLTSGLTPCMRSRMFWLAPGCRMTPGACFLCPCLFRMN